MYNNAPPPRPDGTVHGDAASVKSMVGRGVLLDVAKYKGQIPCPSGYWISSRRSPEYRQSAEGRDPKRRYFAGADGLAEDVGRARPGRDAWIPPIASGTSHNQASGRIAWPSSMTWTLWPSARITPRWNGDSGQPAIYQESLWGFAHRPLHPDFLWNRGAYIMEILNLDELAKDQAYEFLFVLGPLLLRGGIGVPVNPIAIR